jgi:hypothetical protein
MNSWACAARAAVSKSTSLAPGGRSNIVAIAAAKEHALLQRHADL